jgi:hypothetical protein
MEAHRYTTLTAIMAVGAALATTSAQATPVTQWSYSVTSSFASATSTAGGTNGLAFIPGGSTISWGDPSGSFTTPNGGRSGLGITASPATGTIDTNLAPALTNVITHYNNVLNSGFPTLSSATVDATLSLTPLAPSGATLPTFTNTFQVSFAETPNEPGAGGCAVGVPPCADIFVLGAGSLNQSFTYDGSEYFVSIFEATNALNSLPAAACASVGASAPCIGFVTQENQFTPAQFAFRITSAPVTVPEPGSLALLSAMAFGLGARLRRRNPTA